MVNEKQMTIINLAVRLILAAIFIYAAIGKIINPALFAREIDNYRLLPWLLVSLLAASLPWVELGCGLLLIAGRWLRPAALILIALNVVFILAMASALLRGLNINCGCFSLGEKGSQVGLLRIVEDLVFLGMAVWVYWKGERNIK
ncbi:MAG TPA: MauE/DoxX family redox-associated membrane protein [bacterium]|nr:MauE/DoxX family redox-associated membrane protein [bacterium]HPN44669.1 MauE/DoxX family redox-associated membrane protein [bacterium]